MIPFNKPEAGGSELDRVHEAMSQAKLSGDGPFAEQCQTVLSGLAGGGRCFLTPSCTAALEMSAMLLDLAPGDEVIMPSFTFVSTANAVVLRGAMPVFIDIRPDTLNIDERLVEGAITPRTKAIIAVHYAGVPADMDPLVEIAKATGRGVVEDAAQALGSTYRGRKAGGLGDMSAFSFHETKNIVSGEGGALLVNGPQWIERAEIIREKGTNRRNLLRGLVDKYTWVDIGSSYLTSELVSSFLLGQLQDFDNIQRARMEHWNFYFDELVDLENFGFRRPCIPKWCTHNAHLFYLLAPTAQQRDRVIAKLREDGIAAPFHYIPLHSAPAGRRYARTGSDMSVTDDISARLLRLPLYRNLGTQRETVVERVRFHARSDA